VTAVENDNAKPHRGRWKGKETTKILGSRDRLENARTPLGEKRRNKGEGQKQSDRKKGTF